MIEHIKRHVSPELFQNLVNFCLVQSHRYVSHIKYFVKTCHANPNALVPIIVEDRVDSSMIQLWYDDEQANRLNATESWIARTNNNSFQWTSSATGTEGNSVSTVKYMAVLHIVSAVGHTDCSPRISYLINECNANPFIVALVPNIANRTVLSIAALRKASVYDFYFKDVFPKYVDNLAIYDNKIWITP